MRKLFKIIIVMVLVAIMIFLIVLAGKIRIANQIKEYLEASGTYTMNICITENNSNINNNFLIKGNKTKNNIYGKFYLNNDKLPISEFYMNSDKILVNLKTIYDYTIDKFKLSGIKVINGLTVNDTFVSNNMIEELLEIDNKGAKGINSMRKNSLITSVIKIKKCNMLKDSFLINDNDEFEFYSTKYKNKKVIVGIDEDSENLIRIIYFYYKEKDEIIEVKYTIQKNENAEIKFPKENEIGYLDKLILKEIIKQFKELNKVD